MMSEDCPTDLQTREQMLGSLDGATLVREIGADPSLDMALLKDPRDVTDADLELLVANLRRERALFISKGEKP